MTAYWSWWAGGLALAAVPLANWLVVRRLLAVSGRYTALVDRVRSGPPEDTGAEMSEAELLEAVRAATRDAFGADALEPVEPPAPEGRLEALVPPRGAAHHVVFLVALAAGGALSMGLAGGVDVTPGLRGEGFAATFGTSPMALPAVLVAGGLLVGFGTRMAAGCTSGHGLCGVSRAQPGSLLATAAFFGMGIAVSLLMGSLR
jgi:uncharacterized protein